MFASNTAKIYPYNLKSEWAYLPCNFPWIKFCGTKRITTDGTSVSYSVTLSDNSPFRNPPIFIVHPQSTSITLPTYTFKIQNTWKGNLSLVITFSESPQEGSFDFIWFSNPSIAKNGQK